MIAAQTGLNEAMMQSLLVRDDGKKLLLVLTGPNGAGKSTFYELFIQENWAAPFVNADLIAATLDVEPGEDRNYRAAKLAEAERKRLLDAGNSFVFETVFSDTNGSKLRLLKRAAQLGYRVTLVFIGIGGTEVSEARVMGRVTHGGHDVPTEKLRERYPRTLANLRAALPHVDTALLLDNDSATLPYALVALVHGGIVVHRTATLPPWASTVLEA